MTSTKPPPPNELLRRGAADEIHRLEQITAMLKHRDPLANNPKMFIEHVFTLIRPQELMAAEFIWSGLCKHYEITKTNAERLRYVARVMSDYAIIEAHTHLHEPLFEREKN